MKEGVCLVNVNLSHFSLGCLRQRSSLSQTEDNGMVFDGAINLYKGKGVDAHSK